MNREISTNQKGAALMGMVLVIFISASTLLFSAVRPPNPVDAIDARTFQELRAAKASLISFSTNFASNNTDDLGPGRLPCPAPWTDTVNGKERWVPYWGGCNWQYVLRLPEYATVSSGNDFYLNDYYADRDLQFWYAISGNYRWYNSITTAVNTTTSPILTLDGEDVVAVIIAPGPALEGQDRQATESYSSNRYGAYENLEGDNKWWGNTTFISNYPSDPQNFNDVVLGITHSELMTPATAIVISELKPLLDIEHPLNGDAYPTNETDFHTATADAPAWYFNEEWDSVLDPVIGYTLVDDDTVQIKFEDCAVVYTLRFQDPDPDADIIVPVSRNPQAC